MLRGKTAIITGANRGIGLAILELFAENGADIIACCRTVDSELESKFCNLERQYSVNIVIQTLDLSNEQSVKMAAKEILREKKCDILINCAGIFHTSMLQTTTITDIRKVFEVNYFNQIAFTQSLARFMSRQKSGSIVNVASIVGMDVTEGNVAYGASKAALILLTKTLAAELARYDIRVNAVAPGVTETDMLNKITKDGINEFINRNLMQRIGKPREIAQVILFLASDMSSFVTGQTIRVDGGLL